MVERQSQLRYLLAFVSKKVSERLRREILLIKVKSLNQAPPSLKAWKASKAQHLGHDRSQIAVSCLF
ncbi:MAG: hypothetical protein EAZ94_07440 [Oscillatoriales cyanobacterium]|nr:MAG: hypothetical protein EAZ94_07440 [Oscillatoriales cyanobacterium]TAE20237.1 MAG: hypothetical protein EAZ93_25110 [Oscillatoriales cyanobacterium]TAG41954.1 MAG: hypothetical protein EAZ33_16060 [Oscillatoriales cyanobacterium]TAG55624.1 MAG: hypothetical protein EAZ28_21985 [Oscillatoriales cyanobacterium]